MDSKLLKRLAFLSFVLVPFPGCSDDGEQTTTVGDDDTSDGGDDDDDDDNADDNADEVIAAWRVRRPPGAFARMRAAQLLRVRGGADEPPQGGAA